MLEKAAHGNCEPSLPPSSLNWGPAPIYRSGQTGSGLLVAGRRTRGPFVLPWFPPVSTIHHLLGPHRWFRRKSRATLCHLLESFNMVHVLTEAFLGFQYMCPDSPRSTIYHVPLLQTQPCAFASNQLHLSNFSTVVGLQNSPAHSLESVFSKLPCQVRPLNDKKLPWGTLGKYCCSTTAWTSAS